MEHCIKQTLSNYSWKKPNYRGTDFPRLWNRRKAYLKRNSRNSAKTVLITSKKHTLSKQTFQRHFENRKGRYLTTLIFVSVTPN